METILQFFTDFPFVIDIISILFYVVISSVFYKKTVKNKNIKEVLEEMKKYRLEDYQFEIVKDEKTKKESVKKVDDSQKFSYEKDEYKLNKATEQLESVGKINILELVNSALDTALDNVLEKFLPNNFANRELKESIFHMEDDLDTMIYLAEKSDKYKKDLNLPSDYSMVQVFKAVQSELDKKREELLKVEKTAVKDETLKVVDENLKNDEKSQGEEKNA